MMNGNRVRDTGIHFILAAGVLLSVFPFYWLIVIATNDSSAVFTRPPTLAIGGQLGANLASMFEQTEFVRAFGNTVFVAAMSTLLKLIFDSLAGFSFAKFDFPGRKMLFVLLLATMMIPGQLSLVPQFIVMQSIGWIGTFKALIVPGMANAFGIFWIRQYAEEAIPNELMDAARIDGCRTFRLYWHIALPILRPALAFLGIISFMSSWESYLWPLIVLNDSSKFTLMIELARLNMAYGTDFSVLMAGTLLAILPLIVIFLIARRQFIAGIMEGAVKV